MKKKKTINYYVKFYLLLIIISTLFISFGYATINSVLLDFDGDVSVKAPDGLFIVDASPSGVSNGASLANQVVSDFVDTTLSSITTLSSTNNASTVTYSVTIANNDNINYIYDDAVYSASFYSNDNIDYEVTGINHGYVLNSGSTVSFNITFKYKDEYKATSAPYDNVLNSYINFRFALEGSNVYTISYTGLTDFSGLPVSVNEGDTAVINFGDIPLGVISIMMGSTTLSTSDYTFDEGVLSISNVTGNLVLNMAEIGDIEFPVYTGDETTLVAPNVSDTQTIQVGDLVTTPFHGENFSTRTIQKITCIISYSAKTGSKQSMNASIKYGTYISPVQPIEFLGKTTGDLTFEISNLNILPGDTFEFIYETNKITNGSITITKVQIDIEYANS